MKRNILFYILLLVQVIFSYAQKTEVYYLSGTDNDNPKEWEFFCTEGMNSGKWTTIHVPSCWEQEGFGAYNYGHDKNPHHEQGHYRYSFESNSVWKGKKIFLCFQGVMTDATVSLNGSPLGEKHQGAFYPFRYEITDQLVYGGKNTLDVIVDKESSNESINKAERRADYWIFGGIFRPVFIEVQPQQFIKRVAIDARHTGSFAFKIYVNQPSESLSAEMEIFGNDGHRVGQKFKAQGLSPDGSIMLAGEVSQPKAWTAETPNLYEAVILLKKGVKKLHEYHQKFGFRTVEFRHSDGFYVNDVKVKFKGVCRHTFWPESGRASSRARALDDIRIIKEMNINAVRMSHYPPDDYFLDMCDSMGLYILDELAGWQDKYDTETAHRLIAEMLQRDVNHPSIVAWDNGNEGGFNFEVRRDYAIWDPQHRHVIEPWSKLDGLDTHHYPKYDYTFEAVTKGNMVYMPTESLHGLHDGGHGAGLDDYWELLRKAQLSAGLFLWNLADEGVMRKDIHDSIDVFNDKAPDGILGPHHEKEGSFFTIKQIWSPVFIKKPELEEGFDGTLDVENRYEFTDLKACSFSFSLLRYESPLKFNSEKIYKGEIPTIELSPRNSGKLHIPLPADWRTYDLLAVTAFGPEKEELFTWKWNYTSNKEMAERILKEKSMQHTQDEMMQWMKKLEPRIVGNPMPGTPLVAWKMLDSNTIQLDYQYTLNGDYFYAGVGFSMPENDVEGAVLMADGPYRVWKNRLKGPTFGIYEKKYNNTITGQDWEYPEFKGYYANLSAIQLNNRKAPDVIFINPEQDRYLHLFTPQRPIHYSKNVDPPFPAADISVLNVIPAIGTKFSQPEQEGPQGKKEHFDNQIVNGTIFIRFGSPE